jgi:hypothetical protein
MFTNRSDIDGWQILIMDTGPLWELVLYSAVNELGFIRLKPELRHLRDHASYQRLSAFIARFGRKTTSTYVVAEISAWVSRTEKSGHANIWRLVYDEFASMGMEESILTLLELPIDIVAAKGAVDASVLELGIRLATQKPKVLTIDSPLIAECRRNGLRAFDLWQVIAEES